MNVSQTGFIGGPTENLSPSREDSYGEKICAAKKDAGFRSGDAEVGS